MRLGVDVGGTFTDVVAVGDDGRITTGKVPTTPGDLSEGVLAGVARLARDAVGVLVHGTTVGTNALIERKGARTGLLTTEGFRDVLEIGRVQRPAGGLYDFNVDNPPPLIPRALRLEARERVGADGAVVVPLDEASVRAAAARLAAEGVEAVAVSFLFSFLRPDHERRAGEILREALPGVTVSLSSDVSREFREYERTSTAAASAYLQPIVERYLARLAGRLRERHPKLDLRLIQANGGSTSPEAVRGQAVMLVNSGPAGGATACAELARRLGVGRVVGVDMGGTSFDICLIEGERAAVTTDGAFMGLPLKIPMIDVDIIGAGGGSIGWIDRGGALNVGPQSAGAEPGPACYGRGGEEPTVTDANLVLGRIDPAYFLGGEMSLDAGAARRAVERRVAGPLGMSIEEAAAAMVKIVDATMSRGIAVKSVHKGHDLREFALAAYGGAGPLHAVALAEDLGIRDVIIPAEPGVFSALGLLFADARHDYVSPPGAGFDEMERAGRAQLEREGFTPDRIDIRRSADLRYEGQSYELNVPFEGDIEKLFADFAELHERVYSFKAVDEKTLLVNLRVTAWGRSPAVRLPEVGAGGDARKGTRRIWFDGFVETPIYERRRLGAGQTVDGPAAIEEAGSVTIVHPGWRATVERRGDLRIRP